ncbi:MAG: hypothetical protein K8F91_19245, partial [Candidatus Obscuribacterales bacterium]|nr:hypothetical protein [Candidatus Obscuribacterales bacterium]
VVEGREIDDLDGGKDTNKLYKSLTHGQAPIIEHFDTAEEQAAFIETLLANSEVPTASTCVVARTNNEVSAIQELLELRGLKTSVIRPNKPEEDGAEALKLATVHRVKGLEFDQVILASANEGLVPLDSVIASKADAVSQDDADTEERSLVYVGITRARKAAFVLSYGQPSRYFR